MVNICESGQRVHKREGVGDHCMLFYKKYQNNFNVDHWQYIHFVFVVKIYQQQIWPNLQHTRKVLCVCAPPVFSAFSRLGDGAFRGV